MQRGKGKTLVVVLILLLGIGITTYTRSFVSSKATGLEMEYEAANNKMAPIPMPKETTSSADTDISTFEAKTTSIPKTEQSNPNIVSKETSQIEIISETANQEIVEMDGEKTTDTSFAVISPLSGSSDTATALYELSIEEQKKCYLDKLQELDVQIDKIWKEDTDGTTYSMKSTAEYVFKLWDKELNSIYGLLRSSLTEEEAEVLKKEELEWIKERDAIAAEAATKRSGGSLEGLEYTTSMTNSTKERTYILVEQYFAQKE